MKAPPALRWPALQWRTHRWLWAAAWTWSRSLKPLKSSQPRSNPRADPPLPDSTTGRGTESSTALDSAALAERHFQGPIRRCGLGDSRRPVPARDQGARHAKPSSNETCDRPRPLCVCDAALRQSRARQHLGERDGERPRDPEAHLGLASGLDDPLRFVRHPHEPGILGALRAASVSVDPAGSDPACSRPFHPVSPGRAHYRHARLPRPVRNRERLRGGAAEILGALAALRSRCRLCFC